MKKLIIILSIIVIIPVLTLGYLGLVPGISDAFGTNKPKNLGVQFSQQDLTSGNQKTQVEISSLPESTSVGKSLVYEGQHQAELTLTSQEITAMANNSKWKHNPLSQIQVRVNPDGSAEASGYIDFNTAKSYALSFGVSSDDIDKVLEKFPIPQTKFPFYIKGTGNVNNDQIELDISNLKLANIPVPTNIVDQYLQPALSFVEDKYLSNDSVNIQTLENKNGQAYFKGTLPNKELSVQ